MIKHQVVLIVCVRAVCACVHVRVYNCVHAYMCMRAYICICVYVFAHVCVHACAYMCVCKYVCVCMCMHVCMSLCVCLCMYVYNLSYFVSKHLAMSPIYMNYKRTNKMFHCLDNYMCRNTLPCSSTLYACKLRDLIG